MSRPVLSESKLGEPTARVQKLIDDYLSLNVLESLQFVDALKSRIGYVEQAPVAMAVAAPAASAPAAAAPAAEEKKEEKKAEPTAFTVRLQPCDPKNKIKVIKEVRGITNLGLTEVITLLRTCYVHSYSLFAVQGDGRAGS